MKPLEKKYNSAIFHLDQFFINKLNLNNNLVKSNMTVATNKVDNYEYFTVNYYLNISNQSYLNYIVTIKKNLLDNRFYRDDYSDCYLLPIDVYIELFKYIEYIDKDWNNFIKKNNKNK